MRAVAVTELTDQSEAAAPRQPELDRQPGQRFVVDNDDPYAHAAVSMLRSGRAIRTPKRPSGPHPVSTS
jgi:hypothetical protein